MQYITRSVKALNVRCVVNIIKHNNIKQHYCDMLSTYKPENGTTGIAPQIKNQHLNNMYIYEPTVAGDEVSGQSHEYAILTGRVTGRHSWDFSVGILRGCAGVPTRLLIVQACQACRRISRV